MVYLFALAAGVFIAALVAAAGISGYAIAHAPSNRLALTSMAGGAALVVVASATFLGSVAYTRLNTVAVVRVPSGAATPGSSGTLQAEPTADAADTPQPATDAWMHFQSDTGDYIGGGVLKVWTIKESDFAVGGTNSYLRASVSGLGDMWYLNFRAPSNGHLEPGLFTSAERAPFVTGKAPGIEIFGDGRGCNTLSGRFQIKSLTWTQAATVAEMDILFEQHCEGMTPALRGELWYTTESGVHKTPPLASSTISF